MSRPPPDRYAGEPGYPAPWTTSAPLEGLRDTDAARIISLAPDVCLTPIGSAMVPVPYQIVDFCGHDGKYAGSVRFTGERAMLLRSHTTHVHGDAPGTGKGVASGTIEGISEPIGHATEVRAEGSPVIRRLDRFWMNNRNTVGEAIFVRDTATYAAPVDDDPVPGSLRRMRGALQLAFAGTPAEFAPQQTPAPGSAPTSPPSQPGTVIQGPWQPRPMPVPPPAENLPWLWRYGRWGLLPVILMLSGDTPLIAPPGRDADAVERGLYRRASEALDPFDHSYNLQVRDWYQAELARYRGTRTETQTEPQPQPRPQPSPVRITPREDRECPIGPHALMQPICAAMRRQAHHVVPDRSFRSGAPGSPRIKDAPSYGAGLAVCVESNRVGRDSEHSIIHNAYYDRTAEREARAGSNPGFITLARAEDLGSQALEAGTDGRCPKEYIRLALRAYHQTAFRMEPDVLVRGQRAPLDAGQSSYLGRQPSAIRTR
jgi:hypothetical protein